MVHRADDEEPEPEQQRVVPSWPAVWQAIQIGLYVAVMTFLAGAITDGIGINTNGTARAALNAGIAAVLGFLGWAAGTTVRKQ
jgi:hypothetical protein